MQVLSASSMAGVGAGREPRDRVSIELQRYARMEGLVMADLRRVRQSHRRFVTAAWRDWAVALRRPRRVVPSRQH